MCLQSDHTMRTVNEIDFTSSVKEDIIDSDPQSPEDPQSLNEEETKYCLIVGKIQNDSEESVRKEINMIIDGNVEVYECDKCSTIFRTEHILNQHTCNVHLEKNECENSMVENMNFLKENDKLRVSHKNTK